MHFISFGNNKQNLDCLRGIREPLWQLIVWVTSICILSVSDVLNFPKKKIISIYNFILLDSYTITITITFPVRSYQNIAIYCMPRNISLNGFFAGVAYAAYTETLIIYETIKENLLSNFGLFHAFSFLFLLRLWRRKNDFSSKKNRKTKLSSSYICNNCES